MRPFAPARSSPFDYLRKAARRLKRRPSALANYFAGQSARLRLTAKFPKNSGQLFRAGASHELSCCERLASIHPHVQRAFVLEAESALSPVQLRRAHTEIQQHTITTVRRDPVRQL